MNVTLLVRLLEAYFTYTGIRHKFTGSGLFAHVDLAQRLRAFSDRFDSDKNFQAAVNDIQSWDGEFNTLDQHRRTLVRLASLLLYDVDMSQAQLIKRWKSHCIFTKTILPVEAAGICYGLAMASLLMVDENTLHAATTWNGNYHDDSVAAIFHSLATHAVPLQEDQDGDFQPVSGLVADAQIPELKLGVAFVHNAATLRTLLTMVLKSGHHVLLGAADHVVRISVMQNNQIEFYDPNSKFGYGAFQLDELEYLMSTIRYGFENHYANRFGMVVKVYADHTASSYDLHAVMKHLEDTALQSGITADRILNAIGPDGKNALLLAAEANLLECVRYLAQRGCNPNIRAIKSLNNAFHSAASIKKAETMLALLEAGKTDLNSYNRSGLTPLQVAVYDNCPAIVKTLLGYAGVNVGKLTGSKSGVPGKTAMQMAAMLGRTEILEMLAGKYAQSIIAHAARGNCS